MRSILIVDDDKLTINLIRLYLSGDGYEISSEESGTGAIERLREKSFDVVLLDVVLPDSSGYDVCRSIVEQFKGVSVIIVTSLEDDVSIEKAFESGAVDYLRKPISRIELHSRLKNVIETIDAKTKLESMYATLIKELDVAKNVQSYFIPDPVQIESRLGFSSFYRPSNKVGGDLFDIKKLSDSKYLVYIGDISGHGVQAALLMTAIKFIINMIADQQSDEMTPASIMSKFNKIFCSQLKKKGAYLTLSLGIIDLEKMEFSCYNAGHPPLLMVDLKKGLSSFCESKGGIPIGWKEDFEYTTEDTDTIKIDKHTIFLMYTDGIFESKGGSDKYMGITGFKAVIESLYDFSLFSFPHLISQTISQQNYTFDDDYTLLCWSLLKPDKKYLFCRNSMQDVLSVTESIAKIFNDAEKERNSKGLWVLLNQDLSTFFKKKTNDCSAGFIVKLALHEWLMNVVRHGNPDNEVNQIILEINTDQAELKVYDFGKEWDFQKRKMMTLDPDSIELDPYRESGRGLQMIFSLTQEFDFKRVGSMNIAFFKFKKEMEIPEI